MLDFETLSTDVSSVILTVGAVRFDPRGVGVMEKLELRPTMEEQTEIYNRTISDDTLRWWGEQNKEAQKALKPSSDDMSIDQLHSFIVTNVKDSMNLHRTYTRGNTFDCIFLEQLMIQTGHPSPFSWRRIRDTRSIIEGMSWGIEMDNGYIPEGLVEKFVPHDPRHDIAMDVMRMQELARAISS
jgi:hypothetical protein